MKAPIAFIYERMYLARRADEELAKAVKDGVIPLPLHLSIGQEAVSAGACAALEKKDVVFGTYRGHALYVAKGGSVKKMFAELWGKATGSAKGKGGSMHLVDVDAGVMGMSAIVGTGVPNATGYALALQYHNSKQVVVNFFGDGATEEGAYHESLNFAALKKLPIIYICENNQYAISTHQKTRQSTLEIAKRAASYGIKTKIIKKNDALAVFEAVKEARQEVLEGKGPIFLECLTYRWKQHLGPNDDFGPGGRDQKEAEPWIKNDELDRIGALLSEKKRRTIEARTEREIASARKFAEASPYPLPAELYKDVYAS